MRKITVDSPLGRRLIESGGVIESGHIANMRTYRLPAWPKVHTRVLGESKTLCGVPLHNHGEWAWQFIHRGVFGQRLPSGAHTGDRDHCTRCARSPVLRATQAANDARVAWMG
jgi:hypothetical protein